MKLHEVLREGVEVHGIKLFAYAITVAELYDALPDFDPEAIPSWTALIESNEKLAKVILGKINVEYVKDDPYKSFNALLKDVLVNKHLAVFKTADSTHPGMSAKQNDLFRALHDALAHAGSNSQEFYAHLLKQQSDSSVGNYKPLWGGSFTVRGEMNAYLAHAKLAPRAAIPALFTEVVGQICVYFATGDYTRNKAAIIEGADFFNVGQCSGHAAERMEEIYRQFMDRNVTTIETRIPGILIKKSEIRWALLSKGTGEGHIT